MAVKTFKRKPDKTDAFKLEHNPDDLREAAKWCNGTLNLKFEDGNIVEDKTFISFLEGPEPVPSDHASVIGQDNRIVSEARIGDYILKYWDTAKHGTGFYAVKGDRFEAEYEL